MHDQGGGEGKVTPSSSLQTGCEQEWETVGDFASSWKRGARKVESAASLMLLVTVEDFAVSWKHGESGGVRALGLGETVISEVAFYAGRGETPWGRKEVRCVST